MTEIPYRVHINAPMTEDILKRARQFCAEHRGADTPPEEEVLRNLVCSIYVTALGFVAHGSDRSDRYVSISVLGCSSGSLHVTAFGSSDPDGQTEQRACGVVLWSDLTISCHT